MEEKILKEDLHENKLQSKKINLGKKIHIAWFPIALIFIIATIFSVFQYVHYNKGQAKAIELTLATFESIGEDNPFAKYEGDSKKISSEMYKWYNRERYTVQVGGQYISNYDVADACDEMDFALGNMMEKAGFNCSRGSEFLEHTNIISYIFKENQVAKILYIVGASLSALQCMFLLWYFSNRKNTLTIEDGRIICKFGKKTTKEFMLKDISIVNFVFLRGIEIKGNNIKYRINFLTNTEELKSYIMNYIADIRNENTDMLTNANPIDALKEYKDLLESGVITQEEFDVKKKQLLGL